MHRIYCRSALESYTSFAINTLSQQFFSSYTRLSLYLSTPSLPPPPSPFPRPSSLPPSLLPSFHLASLIPRFLFPASSIICYWSISTLCRIYFYSMSLFCILSFFLFLFFLLFIFLDFWLFSFFFFSLSLSFFFLSFIYLFFQLSFLFLLYSSP